MKNLHFYVADVEGLTLRSLPGDGSRSELVVRTKHGPLVLQLVARPGASFRVVDLRAKGKGRQKKHRALVSVAMEHAKPRG